MHICSNNDRGCEQDYSKKFTNYNFWEGPCLVSICSGKGVYKGFFRFIIVLPTMRF